MVSMSSGQTLCRETYVRAAYSIHAGDQSLTGSAAFGAQQNRSQSVDYGRRVSDAEEDVLSVNS